MRRNEWMAVNKEPQGCVCVRWATQRTIAWKWKWPKFIHSFFGLYLNIKFTAKVPSLLTLEATEASSIAIRMHSGMENIYGMPIAYIWIYLILGVLPFQRSTTKITTTNAMHRCIYMSSTESKMTFHLNCADCSPSTDCISTAIYNNRRAHI